MIEKAKNRIMYLSMLVKINSITESSGTATSNRKLLIFHLKYVILISYS